MKTLLLLRHATSDPQKEDMADIDRDLSAKGKEEVRDIAKIIKKEGISADLIISSPARRAIETATIFAEVIRYPVNKVEKKEELYHSKTPEPFLKMIARIDKRYQHVMIVGHNPTVSSLASLLLEHFDYSLPKAGIIGIKFPIKSWKDIMESEGDLALFAFPANIKSDVTMDKKFRKNLESKVTEKTLLIFEHVNARIAKKLNKSIKKSSKKLVKEFLTLRRGYVFKSENEIESVLEEMRLESEKS